MLKAIVSACGGWLRTPTNRQLSRMGVVDAVINSSVPGMERPECTALFNFLLCNPRQAYDALSDEISFW
jgi:hypothetical protein